MINWMGNKRTALRKRSHDAAQLETHTSTSQAFFPRLRVRMSSKRHDQRQLEAFFTSKPRQISRLGGLIGTTAKTASRQQKTLSEKRAFVLRQKDWVSLTGSVGRGLPDSAPSQQKRKVTRFLESFREARETSVSTSSSPIIIEDSPAASPAPSIACVMSQTTESLPDMHIVDDLANESTDGILSSQADQAQGDSEFHSQRSPERMPSPLMYRSRSSSLASSSGSVARESPGAEELNPSPPFSFTVPEEFKCRDTPLSIDIDGFERDQVNLARIIQSHRQDIWYRVIGMDGVNS